MRRSITFLLAASLILGPAAGPTLAQRGGRGGGFRGGGGGGYRGGGGMGGYRGGGAPSFNRTPSFSMPAARPQMPAGGYRPNLPQQRPNLPQGNLGANRPNLPQQRPNLPQGNLGANRPNLPQRPTTLPGNIANRPNVPGTPGNRPGYPGYPGNRPGYPGYRPGYPGGNPAWANRPGWAYHQGWVNGYWHGQNNNWWNNWGGFATGMAIGGIGAWGLGSSFWNWGYMPYSNPYYAAPAVVDPGVAVQAPVYDYSQPLSTEAPPPDDAVADPAVQTFDAGRAAFKEGNYAEALRQTDEALKAMPTDAAMHEFRALCLFALKQYDQAAATLYAVLSAGPGWDWTTLIGLYPNVDVYTAQLRDLEAYVGANPTSAPARFVLAYHYLTQGHTENAVAELKQVVQLQPGDKLSAQLAAQLSGSQGQPAADQAAAANPPAEAAAPAAAPDTAPAKDGNIVGTWKASPAQGTTIELTAGADGAFRWTVTEQGKPHTIEGKYTLGNGILAMSQNDSNALVGKVTWQDDSHFLFQAMGGGPGDPGLAFSK